MNVLNARGRVGLKLPATLAEQKLDGSEVTFVYGQVPSELGSDATRLGG